MLQSSHLLSSPDLVFPTSSLLLDSLWRLVGAAALTLPLNSGLLLSLLRCSETRPQPDLQGQRRSASLVTAESQHLPILGANSTAKIAANQTSTLSASEEKRHNGAWRRLLRADGRFFFYFSGEIQTLDTKPHNTVSPDSVFAFARPLIFGRC